MKILFYVGCFPTLSETFIMNQITMLIDQGYDVRIYSLEKPKVQVTHKDITLYGLNNIIYYPLEIPTGKWRKLFAIIKTGPCLIRKYKSKVFKAFDWSEYGNIAKSGLLYFNMYNYSRFEKKEWTPDIIISHFGNIGLFPVNLKSIGVLKAPLITFFHAHEISPYSNKEVKNIYRPFYNNNILLLPISDYWSRKLLNSDFERSRVKVHRMGIDLKNFHYRGVKVNNSEVLHILSVGRLVGQKGYRYSLESIAVLIHEYNLNIRYDIIGSGDMYDELRKLSIDLGIEEYVYFKGALPQQDIILNMEESDYFLLPSIQDNDGMMEGIPVALMEAMAIGIPVISTYHSGIPELIEHKYSGMLCREKEVQDIVNAILYLVTNESARNKIILNARKTVEEKYNIELLNKRLINIINEEIAL